MSKPRLRDRLSDLWMRVWFEPLDPRPLAAFRISWGVYMLGYFLKYALSVETSFSNLGVYTPFLVGDIAPSLGIAYLIYFATLLAIVALIFGVFCRVTTVLVFGLFLYHFFLNFAVNNTAYDRLNCIVLCVLCFCDVGATWSYDARKQTVPRLIPAWQIRLLQFQLAMMYFGAGVWKAGNRFWYSGELIHSVMAGPWSSDLSRYIVSWNLPSWVYGAMTASVVIFELVAGFTLFFKRTRVPTMILGLSFHLGNTFILRIPEFLNCVAMYPLFFEFKDSPTTAEQPAAQAAQAGSAPGELNPSRSVPADSARSELPVSRS